MGTARSTRGRRSRADAPKLETRPLAGGVETGTRAIRPRVAQGPFVAGPGRPTRSCPGCARARRRRARPRGAAEPREQLLDQLRRRSRAPDPSWPRRATAASSRPWSSIERRRTGERREEVDRRADLGSRYRASFLVDDRERELVGELGRRELLRRAQTRRAEGGGSEGSAGERSRGESDDTVLFRDALRIACQRDACKRRGESLRRRSRLRGALRSHWLRSRSMRRP